MDQDVGVEQVERRHLEQLSKSFIDLFVRFVARPLPHNHVGEGSSVWQRLWFRCGVQDALSGCGDLFGSTAVEPVHGGFE